VSNEPLGHQGSARRIGPVPNGLRTRLLAYLLALSVGTAVVLSAAFSAPAAGILVLVFVAGVGFIVLVADRAAKRGTGPSRLRSLTVALLFVLGLTGVAAVSTAIAWLTRGISHAFDCLDVGLQQLQTCEAARQLSLNESPLLYPPVLAAGASTVVLTAVAIALNVARRRAKRGA
jgi:hypothetical protein